MTSQVTISSIIDLGGRAKLLSRNFKIHDPGIGIHTAVIIF